MADEIGRIVEALFAIRDELSLLRRGVNELPTPRPLVIELISERSFQNMDLLKYRVTFPVVPANTDIVRQEFDVRVNGQPQPTQELDRNATGAEFEVQQNAQVDISLIYIDDAANKSQPRTQSFTAVDTIPPEAPGDFGKIEAISEEVKSDPEPAVDPFNKIHPNA
jgi:hypothetical protein